MAASNNLIPVATVIAALLALGGSIVNIEMTRRLARKREEFESRERLSELDAAERVARRKERMEKSGKLYAAAQKVKEAFTTKEAEADQQSVLRIIRQQLEEGGDLGAPVLELTPAMSEALQSMRAACFEASVIEGPAIMDAAVTQAKDITRRISAGWRGQAYTWSRNPDDLNTTYAHEALSDLDTWLDSFLYTTRSAVVADSLVVASDA